MSTSDDERWMRRALDEARRAPEHGDVPVGCVIVRDGEAIATARNERELRQDPTAHAEVLAIRDAALTLGGWRLEPCTMCAGAILQARPERVVWGAPEPATGASGSAIDVFRDARLPTRIPVDDGVLASESAALLRAFFAERRGG